jgi:hypothetical protein
MRKVLSILTLLCLLLSACSLAPAINSQALDYFKANDLAANQIILLNILRAKDGAPLHFSELSQIRGQLSVQASASSTFPFGPLAHATMLPRRLATVGFTVSSAPSFDISSLDTKDFTDGVMTPISPQTAEFFLDEGIDYRMVLMLLVSGIRTAGSPEMLLNAPESSRSVCYAVRPAQFSVSTAYRIVPIDDIAKGLRGPAAAQAELAHKIVNSKCPSGFQGYSEPEYFAFLRTIDHIGRLYPVTIRQPPKPVGAPFTLNMNADLRAITNIDPTKYTLKKLRSGQFELMAASRGSTIVLCEPMPDGSVFPASFLGGGDAQGAKIPVNACDPTAESQDAAADDDPTVTAGPPPPSLTVGADPNTFTLKLRSTFEVIQYVGQVLAFQAAETAQTPDRPERCITIEQQPAQPNAPTCTGGALFHLQHQNSVFSPDVTSVPYDGEDWSLPMPAPCTDPENRCDHTLETMSIISLLLNQNKSAKDIAGTPAVQVVP